MPWAAVCCAYLFGEQVQIFKPGQFYTAICGFERDFIYFAYRYFAAVVAAFVVVD
jgi:hypothetical protein